MAVFLTSTVSESVYVYTVFYPHTLDTAYCIYYVSFKSLLV